jgi:hypothetical protein
LDWPSGRSLCWCTDIMLFQTPRNGFPTSVDPADRNCPYLAQPPTVPSMARLRGYQRPLRGGRGRCRRACERTPLRGRRRCAAGERPSSRNTSSNAMRRGHPWLSSTTNKNGVKQNSKKRNHEATETQPRSACPHGCVREGARHYLFHNLIKDVKAPGGRPGRGR